MSNNALVTPPAAVEMSMMAVTTSHQANVGEISGFGTMPCVLPMRKIMSIIWKPAHTKKKKRMPSTLVDCLEVSKMKNVASLFRPWLSVVLGLTLMYTLFCVLTYKSPPQRPEKEGDNEDIQVIRYINSKTPCGYGCNMAEVARRTNTSTADLMALADPAPRTTRWTLRMPCSRYLNNANDVQIRFKVSKLDFKHRKHIKPGGYFKPRGCEPRNKVAIIVPYRDSETNLLVFLYNIHPFLVKQMLQYRIFVIEQYGHEKLNKGRLFNAAFDQMARFGSWDCVVFHDVNLLPLNPNTSYSCPIVPTLMSTRVIWLNHTVYRPAASSFVGVASMTVKHYRAVNGFSNLYWGSVGADASNMYLRLRAARIPIKRLEKLVGLYTMLPHPTEPNTTRDNRISTGATQQRYKADGLANSNYKTISIRLRSLYTHIVVDINPNNDPTE